MSRVSFIAMYPSDFLADVGHLGNTELGIYWRLLLVYYRDGRALPVDADRLRRIAMTFSPEECRSLDQVVSEFFVMTAEPDGTRTWHHKRADRELSSAIEKHTKASAKASAAAAKRWGKDASSMPQALPEAMPELCQPEPEPEPEEKKHIRAVKARPIAAPDGFADFWAAWPNTERKANKKGCATAWQTKRLDAQRDVILAHIEALRATRKWQEGFEPAPMTYLRQERWKDGEPVGESMTKGFI